MTLVWIILGVPLLVLLCSWDELLLLLLEKTLSRRNDDGPARRRRIVRESTSPLPDGQPALQRSSLFRRKRPIDAGATARGGKHPC